jgi:hypothetical protein
MICLGLAGAMVVAPNAKAQVRGGFEVSTEAFDYRYREREDGKVIVRDDGLFGGIGIGYVETIGGGSFLRGRLRVAAGSVDYRSDGSIVDEPGGEEVRLDNVLHTSGQLELHFGKNFAVGTGATLTPFVGLGSRYLIDSSGGEVSDSGLLGYDREISYAYVPIGADATVPVGRRSVLRLSAQYNLFVGGTAKSRFSKIDPQVPDIEVDTQEGHGLEASAMLGLPVGRRELAFGPFLRFWKIGQSDSILIGPEFPGEPERFVEPRNRTTELGIRVSLAF